MNTSSRPLSSRTRRFPGYLGGRLRAEPAIQQAAGGSTDQGRDPEQQQLRKRPIADEDAGPMLRAGFTEVLVTGMLMR